jgi:hypothetical protein
MKSTRIGGLPLVGNIGDGLEMMKKVWSMTGLPGIPSPGDLASMAARLPQQLPSMVAPTLSVEEIDKRIADLRAVEHWLELNTSMLRANIQSLEVQRATITTLRSLSGGMFPPNIGRGARAPAEAAVPAAPASYMPAPDMYAAAMQTATPAPSEPPTRRAPVRRRRKLSSTAKTGGSSDSPINPSAWWDTLQGQFSKIAQVATGPAPAPAAAAEEKPAPKKTKRKRKVRR